MDSDNKDRRAGADRWTEEGVARQLANANVAQAMRQRLDIDAIERRLTDLERRLSQAGL